MERRSAEGKVNVCSALRPLRGHIFQPLSLKRCSRAIGQCENSEHKRSHAPPCTCSALVDANRSMCVECMLLVGRPSDALRTLWSVCELGVFGRMCCNILSSNAGNCAKVAYDATSLVDLSF